MERSSCGVCALWAVATGRSPPRSPWQNACVERLIGTIRRECLDHIIVFGEAHLRRIVGAYAAYYNESRTHRSLDKDAPFHRAIQRLGTITSACPRRTSSPILFSVHTGIFQTKSAGFTPLSNPRPNT